MKRKGTNLRFEAASSHTNIITDVDGVLIGLLIPAGGVETDLTFSEAIGPFHNVAEVDLNLVPVVTSDGVTPVTVHLPPAGGLVMVGLTTGAEDSKLPMKNFRLEAADEQTLQLDITPIFHVGD